MSTQQQYQDNQQQQQQFQLYQQQQLQLLQQQQLPQQQVNQVQQEQMIQQIPPQSYQQQLQQNMLNYNKPPDIVGNQKNISQISLGDVPAGSLNANIQNLEQNQQAYNIPVQQQQYQQNQSLNSQIPPTQHDYQYQDQQQMSNQYENPQLLQADQLYQQTQSQQPINQYQQQAINQAHSNFSQQPYNSPLQNLPAGQNNLQNRYSSSSLASQQNYINNQSVEQLRYQERLRQATHKQNETYHRFLNQHKEAQSDKDRLQNNYDLMGQQDHQIENQQPLSMIPAPIVSQTPQRRNRLGKIVTQIEMNNPETRKYLKDVLEQQIKEKNQRKQNEIIQHKIYQQGIRQQGEIVQQEQSQVKAHRKLMQNEYKSFLDAQKQTLQNLSVDFTNYNGGSRAQSQLYGEDLLYQDMLTQQQQQQYQNQVVNPPYRYDQSNNYNIVSGQAIGQAPVSQQMNRAMLPPRPGQNIRNIQTQQIKTRPPLNPNQFNTLNGSSQSFLPPLQNQRSASQNQSMTPTNLMRRPPLLFNTIEYSSNYPQTQIMPMTAMATQIPQHHGLSNSLIINQQQQMPRLGSASLGAERRNSQQYFSNLAARNMML
eukprot:403351531